MAFPNKDTQFTSGDVAVEAQKKSAESRKKNREKQKAFREILQEEFSKVVRINGDNSKQVTRKEATALRLMQILLDSGTAERDFIKAMEFARDTIGEKPADRLMFAEVDQAVIEEVERAVLEDDTEAGN